jgi:hypothetical protein
MRLLAATLVAFFLMASPAAAARPCRPAGSKALLTTATTRVYEIPVRGQGYSRVYACRYSVRRPWRLGDSYDASHDISAIEPLQVHGRFLVYSDFYEHYSETAAGITVRDLKTGRRIHRFSRPYYTLAGAVLDSHGSVAWIGKLSDGSFEARRADRKGENTRLDAGSAIEPSSLALRGSTVSWRNGGATKTAPLR